MRITKVTKPHVCFVAPNAYPLLAGANGIAVIGGAELQQVIVAQALVERGYRVSMICLNFGQEDQIEVHGVTVFRSYSPQAGFPVLRFLWPRLTNLWNCLYRVDADIYYQRAAGALTGIVAAFCRRHGKKSIFAAALNSDFEPNALRIRYARDRWIFKYGLRHVDRILTQNEEQARLCQRNFGRNSIIIPNCYPPLASSRSNNACRHVLWVSTIRAPKRPELFLELAEALPNYRFRMIGGPANGEESLFDAVNARAAKIPNVDFLGFVPYAKIDEHFDEAFMFVNTSDSEGFPNTFLQAWARGIPTVSYVDSGARSEGGPLGRQVNSIEQMVDCVAEWLENETERDREGRRCREYFERNHAPERVLDLYEQVFGELAMKVA